MVVARSSSLKLSVELKIHPAASWQSKMAKNGTKSLGWPQRDNIIVWNSLDRQEVPPITSKVLPFLFKDFPSSLPNAHVRYIIYPEMLENVVSGALRRLQRVD